MKQLDLSLFERKLKSLFLFLAVFIFSYNGFSQVQTQKAVTTYIGANIGGFYESLPVTYNSDPSKKFPLIIFLHGAGEIGDGNTQISRVAANGIPKLIKLGQFPSSFTVGGEKFSFIVLSPQCKAVTRDLKSITAMIDYALANYRVDPQRIYLTGLSFGGFLSWNWPASSKTYADRLAALLLVCPGIDTTVNGSTPDPHGYAKNVASSNLPTWITTNQVDPLAYTYKAVALAKFINEYNPTPLAKLSVFPANGHDAWSKTYDPAFKENGLNVYEWMLTYKRGSIITPTPPTTNAGSAQTITLPVNSITLDGTKSAAASGSSIASYAWTKISGPSAGTIATPAGSTTKVNGLTEGTYQFQLKVTDNKGLSSTATVTITVKPALLPPVANAGSAQTITLPLSTVTLNGSTSTAPSGTITSYAWTKVSGPASGTITSPASATSTVTGLVKGVYVFQLKVTDNNGASSTATVSVTVNAAPIPPVANAGSDQTMQLPLNTVTIDATKSTAPAGSISSYAWTKISGPSGGSITAAANATTAVTALTAGTYEFQVKVTDNLGSSATDIVIVTVKPAPLPPLANAGTDKTIQLPLNDITLNGTASTAPGGTITDYLWTKVSGPAAGNIIDPISATTSVGNLVEGIYQFQLKITDNNGNSAIATVNVTVKAAPLPPVANAGTDQTITLPTNSVTLDGNGSIAPSGTITSYAWTKKSGPSAGAIANAANASTIVNGLVEGVYQFELTVTDNNGATSTATVTITVKAAPLPPVANAGTDQTITLPTNSVTLDGSGSTAPAGSITAYAWTKISGPSGSIVSATNASTAVNGLVEGVYKFQLKVTDNNGATSTATVTVTVKAAPLPPVANAGSAKTITLPLSSVTLDGSKSTAPSGSITSYVWTKVSGPASGTITDAAGATTAVNGLAEGVYQFELKVTDNNGATSTASVTVTVKAAPLPPVANAGSAQTIVLPDNSVTLDGTKSTASSGSIVSYAWTKVSGPADGTIASASSASTPVAGLTEGVYQFELKVTDSNGGTSTATVTITVEATPVPPVANAGADQTITLPTNSITLDGSGSTAPAGSITAYAWTKSSGPSAGAIADATSAGTAVSGLVEGVYQFELKVTDNNGATSTATVTITVKAAPLPPVANAGTDQAIMLPTNSVTLDGSGSTAPAGSITSYAWTKVSGPADGNIANATSASTAVSGLVEGVYEFELTVTDNNGNTATSSVTITVSAAPLPPVANAGGDQTISLPTNSVTLDGSGSTAPAGSITSYAWTKVSGPADGTITDATSAGTVVSGLVEGVYQFELTVTDNNGATSTATVTITVNAAPLPPVANAGTDQTITLPTNSVTLDGTGSTAPAGSIVSYAWTKVSGPVDGTIADASGASTAVSALVEGVYKFQLKVTDNNGATSTATVTITVKAAPLPPVANAGSAQTITLPLSSVTLDGSKSTAPSGSITSYAWTKVSGPASGTITDAAGATTAVNGLAEGVYQFELKVTDNNGATSTASLTVTVKAAPLPPVANAGSAQTIVLPDNSVTLDGTKSTASSGSIVSYAWTKVSGPADGTIASASSASTPVAGLTEGVYQFELKVTDSNGGTSTATVTITVEATPVPPVANAGADQTITLPTNSITLDGSGSTAPAGSITAYAWTKSSGPSAGAIADATSAGTAVSGLVEGVYQFELKVTDNNGATSTATVTITVKAAPLPPVANAGTDQAIMLPTNSVTLDGSGSTAPAGSITSYAWTKVSGPADGNIANATSASTAVSGLVEGVYEFELTVTDNNGNTATSSVTITVSAAPLPPVANAGSDQTISLPTNSVILDGTGSTAPAGSITSYAWTKVSGPADGTITDATSAGTVVSDLVEGVYQFELTVTDNNGATSTAIVTITVNAAPLLPTADAGSDQTIRLPKSTVMLDGSDSYAPAGAITSYAWTKISGPADGIVTSAFNVNTMVNGLTAGVYQFMLTITDNNGATATDTVTVTVNPALIPPVANAGSEQTIVLPINSVTLDGSGSTAPSGSITSYIWTKASGPAEGTITSGSTATTAVNGLVEGVYKFQLKVIDNNGSTSTATVTITVKAAPLPPVANAGSAQTIVLPTNSVTLDGSASTAPSGSITSYAWTKIAGPADGVISDASSSTPGVSGLTEGVYEFELTVTDNNGATSTATVTVTVKATPPPPVANAGNAQTIVLPVNSVKVDGSKSSSASGTITSYSWTKLSGPAGGNLASDATAVSNITDLEEGVYQFQLEVADDLGGSATAVVTITVKAAPLPPVANAGIAQTITLPTSDVVLDATKSTAPAGQIKSYVWTKIAGPSTGIILDPLDAKATVTGLIAGIYQFQVKVTDNNGNSSTAIVSVTVNPEPHKPPVADAGEDQIVQLPLSSIQLDGSKSYAQEGSINSYSWSVISGSAPLSIVNATTVNPSILSIAAGGYVIRLKVTDTNGEIDSSDVQLVVLPEDVKPEMPTAYIEADSTVSTDESEFMIDGSNSYAPNGKIEKYEWKQVAGPTSVVITSPESNKTSVKNFAEGEYEFELVVTDNKGFTARTSAKIMISNPGGRPDLSGEMSVYPNPTQSVVNIKLKNAAKGRTMMDVYDLLGKRVLHQEVIKDAATFNQKLDLSKLVRGVYFIEIIIDYKYRLNYKVVKQ